MSTSIVFFLLLLRFIITICNNSPSSLLPHSLMILDLPSPSIAWELNSTQASCAVEQVLSLFGELLQKPATIGAIKIKPKKIYTSKFFTSSRTQHIILFEETNALEGILSKLHSSNALDELHDLVYGINVAVSSSKILPPTPTKSYGNVRYVVEANWLTKQEAFLCRSCTQIFFKGTWSSLQQNHGKIKNFHRHQILSLSVDISSPITEAELWKFSHSVRYETFIFPEALALLHFSQKYNATILLCDHNEREKEHKLSKAFPKCFKQNRGELHAFFSTSDLNLIAAKDSDLHGGTRFYTDGRFEITFLTANKYEQHGRYYNLLIKPLGEYLLGVTLITFFSITLLFWVNVKILKNPKSISTPLHSIMFNLACPIFNQAFEWNEKMGRAALSKIKIRQSTLSLILICWLFYCLILTETYRGKMFKYLSVPAVIAPPQTFRELAEPDSPYGQVLTFNDTFKSIPHDKEYATIFQTANETFYYNSKPILPVPFDGLGGGMRRLYYKMKSSHTALIAAKELLQIVEAYFMYVEGVNRGVTLSSDYIVGNKVWLLYRKHGMEELRETFVGLVGSGLLTRTRKRLYETFAKVFIQKAVQFATETGIRERVFPPFAFNRAASKLGLGIEHLQGIFFMHFVGLGLICLLFIGEIFKGKCFESKHPVSHFQTELLSVGS